MTRFILFFALFFCLPTYAAMQACVPAESPASPNFCSTFDSSAVCYCSSSGLPASMCQDINEIYDRMISIFGSVEMACNYQQEIPVQSCIDEWACYRSGGRDSQGNLCNSTGKSC